jgi:hypothetical protein
MKIQFRSKNIQNNLRSKIFITLKLLNLNSHLIANLLVIKSVEANHKIICKLH